MPSRMRLSLNGVIESAESSPCWQCKCIYVAHFTDSAVDNEMFAKQRLVVVGSSLVESCRVEVWWRCGAVKMAGLRVLIAGQQARTTRQIGSSRASSLRDVE